MRAYFKIVVFLISALAFIATTILLYPLLRVWPYPVRRILIEIVRFYIRVPLWLFNIHPVLVGAVEEIKKGNALIVSNHLSYIDVLGMLRHFSASFVTSVEIKETLFLGQLVSLAGCLFVERRDRRNLGGEISEIKNGLLNGFFVAFFPEATSTNGESILKFKRPLFQASLDSGVPLLPMTLNYKKVNGELVTKSNRDLACWYGDMDFFPHLKSLASVSEMILEITIHERLFPKEGETTQELSERAHSIISSAFHPIS